ncbi:hypothetical protein Pla52o_19290 [Novipirellula galeiformis]|uniref:Uncharacterized protein n=1 Tax=Novipirellula galeiformis TaxID=2528004 RepID=A0A5C6CLI9_9BACT|nr:hypothetical protein Pla52o_19290 [Novipirellula galeiformis]
MPRPHPQRGSFQRSPVRPRLDAAIVTYYGQTGLPRIIDCPHLLSLS